MSAELKVLARSHARIAFAVSLALAGAAAAQAPEDEVQEMVITGTRIQSPNATSTSPILSVTSEEIKTGGRQDLTDMLNMLPQINSNSLGQDLGNKTSGLSSAGGVATANLRGLGPNRTLVLVNGRRLGQGSPQTVISSPAPDIDQIPSALVERVEVVTGGASAVYGSDAIAGVVNFITKKNFEGVQFDGQIGGNWHDNHNSFVKQRIVDVGDTPLTGTQWDGKTVNATITAGANLADDRGNVTAYFGYQKMDPVSSSQRDWGGCQLSYSTEELDDVACVGSSNSNFFKPSAVIEPDPDNPGQTRRIAATPGGPAYSVFGNNFVPQGSVATNPPASFNSQKYIYMQRDDVRYNAGFMANVKITEGFNPYAEFTFMDDRTHQEVAPTAAFGSSNVLSDSGNWLVNCSNPLLSAQQAGLLCSPAQIAADAANPGSVLADVDLKRRNVEGGARTYDYQHTNYRMVFGAVGDLGDGWNYDAYGQYYYTNFANVNRKDFGIDKINNALLVTGTAANPVCISGGACVPYNIFSDGGVTQDAVSYLEQLGTATGSTELSTLHLDVTGDLGQYGIKLPTATEGAGVNVGYEHRREKVRYTPDAATESGLIAGAGGAAPRIDNSLSVSEVFGEVRLPLVQEKRGIHDLVFDVGYRKSQYSTDVETDTYKVELQYAPTPDFRFRGSYNRAIRAPSIVELYNPQLVGKVAFGEDPCAPSEDTGVIAATLAQCLNTGATAAQYNAGIPQGTAGQLTQLQGGNPDLKPEKADTYTIGVTLTPEFLPNFSGSVDYYHIKLEDQVGALPGTVILAECLATGDPTYCSQLVRQPQTGTLNGASVAGGGYIVQTNVNIGAAELSGIDVQAAYRFDLGELGRLRLMLNGAYQLTNESTPIAGEGTYDCAGLFGSTCQTVNPVWRHNMRAAWTLPVDVTLTATWRFMSGVDLDNNDSNPLLQNASLGAPAIFRASMPAVSYLDLGASWDYTEQLSLRVGINNILDRDPPISPADIIAGGAPNYYEIYDGLGRQVFAGVTMKF
jgi:iron complex outermembrane receptor protein